MAIDPVCGIEVDERTAEKARHQDTLYHFCSKDCKDEFEASPEDYIGGEEDSSGEMAGG